MHANIVLRLPVYDIPHLPVYCRSDLERQFFYLNNAQVSVKWNLMCCDRTLHFIYCGCNIVLISTSYYVCYIFSFLIWLTYVCHPLIIWKFSICVYLPLCFFFWLKIRIWYSLKPNQGILWNVSIISLTPYFFPQNQKPNTGETQNRVTLITKHEAWDHMIVGEEGWDSWTGMSSSAHLSNSSSAFKNSGHGSPTWISNSAGGKWKDGNIVGWRAVKVWGKTVCDKDEEEEEGEAIEVDGDIRARLGRRWEVAPPWGTFRRVPPSVQ